MYDSFVIGLVLLLIPHRPWMLRVAPNVMGPESTVYLLIHESPRNTGKCSAPNSVTPKEGGLHARSVGTGIDYKLTLIGICIIMG